MLNKSTSNRKVYRDRQMSFLINLLWASSMTMCFITMIGWTIAKCIGDNYISFKASLCTLISGIATIITTIFKCLFTALSIKATISICIIAIVFSILFFILYKRDKIKNEMEYVIVRVRGVVFYNDECKGGILKSRRNRKILYESHIKTLYKMYRISNKFETKQAKEAFIKEFVDGEITALEDDLKKLSDEMEYEIKAKDEEILKAYRKLKS